MMYSKTNILVVIPARGGSKGIARKNLRSLNGRPLISYAIDLGLKSKYSLDVYVSSDDDEIVTIASKLGAKTIARAKQFATDETTLDPVIYSALQLIEEKEGKSYQLVITLQPTSPLLKVSSLDSAIHKILTDDKVDTIISAVNDTHLTWKLVNDTFQPNYEERVNRQYLPPVFKETGGFLISKALNVTERSRIGSRVHLHILDAHEAIDIDTYADWGLCEFYLKRKRVLFVVSGNQTIGLGHVYNTLSLANDILDHELIFLVDKDSALAFDKIASKNYQVQLQKSDFLLNDIHEINPDVVINDLLDTSADYIKELKSAGYKVINFEDLGAGAKIADLTINAIYPEDEVIPNHYFGYKYFVLRDEFTLTQPAVVKSKVQNVLLSFGGVDPNNLTERVLEAIYETAKKRSMTINVVTGFGYAQYEVLEKYTDINIHKNVTNISEYMSQADIAFTSAGRTTYEIASLHVPTIVLAQNERELTHFFATVESGFINLGLGENVSREEVLQTFIKLADGYEQRQYMSLLMSKCDLTNGKARVISLIKQAIEL